MRPEAEGSQVGVGDGTNQVAINTAPTDAEANAVNRLSTLGALLTWSGSAWVRTRAGVTAATATLTGFLNTLPWAIYNATPTTRTEGQGGPLQASALGAIKADMGTLLAGEDLTNGVMKVEHQYTYTKCTADTQVKASAGFVHAVILQQADAVPTAGTIIVYDNTAESGTAVLTEQISATSELGIDGGAVIIIDALFPTGIYVGFTTTADVICTIIWR